MDLKAVMEEDDKWFKKQQESKNKKKEEPIKIVKLANGKVKKGSGMRYDRKLGFERLGSILYVINRWQPEVGRKAFTAESERAELDCKR